MKLYSGRRPIGHSGWNGCFFDAGPWRAPVSLRSDLLAAHVEADTGIQLTTQSLCVNFKVVDREKVLRADKVGGFDEEFKVAFNDIDYCLRVRELDKKVVYNSFAALTHYESKSRGAEDTPEKKQRFADEIRMFQERWADILRDGDPYYNVNLALDRADFAIRQS